MMCQAVDVVNDLKSAGLGFERVDMIHGSTFKDTKTIIICPTRGLIHHRVSSAIHGLVAPMNQARSILFAVGHEVGKAYNALIEAILKDPNLSTWKYVLTVEDDNLPPPDAHIRLLESIEETKFDAMSGIYFTKGDYNMPMAYGDPSEYLRTGVLDFRPLDIKDALQRGTIMEVNGIAMGCAIWKLDLFRKIPAPWFSTLSDWVPDQGVTCMTQDLEFCAKAKRAGFRFGVDFRVRVGHMDVNTGIVY